MRVITRRALGVVLGVSLGPAIAACTGASALDGEPEQAASPTDPDGLAPVGARAPSRSGPRIHDAIARVSRSACACPRVRLTCQGRLGFASADTDTCTIDALPSTCVALGLAEGDELAPEALLGAPVRAVTSAEAAYQHCSLVHEARHACVDLAETSYCAGEIAAYGDSIACLEAVRAEVCGSEPSALCDRLSDFVAAQRAVALLNRCLCRAGTTCASCRAACEALGPASTCAEAAQAYCAQNGR